MKRQPSKSGLRENSRWSFAALVSGIVLVLHGGAAQAWAQKLQESLPADEDKFIRWGIAAGIAVIIALPAFLNPKRSHLT